MPGPGSPSSGGIAAGPRHGRGRVRRAAGYLLAAVLAGLGAVAAMAGTGLALIGACCAGPALAAGGAAAVTAGAGAAADGGPSSWVFLAGGAVLGVAAAATHRWIAQAPPQSRRSTAEVCPRKDW